MEIERKWLLSSLPKRNVELLRHYQVEQFYLAITPDVEVRLRKMKPADDFVPLRPGDFGGYFLTIKGNGSIARKEVQTSISEYFYEENKNNFLNDKKLIKKDFYIYKLPDGKELECSYVDDKWFYAEIEFETEEEAKAYHLELPEVEIEITNTPEFKMKRYWQITRK